MTYSRIQIPTRNRMIRTASSIVLLASNKHFVDQAIVEAGRRGFDKHELFVVFQSINAIAALAHGLMNNSMNGRSRFDSQAALNLMGEFPSFFVIAAKTFADLNGLSRLRSEELIGDSELQALAYITDHELSQILETYDEAVFNEQDEYADRQHRVATHGHDRRRALTSIRKILVGDPSFTASKD